MQTSKVLIFGINFDNKLNELDKNIVKFVILKDYKSVIYLIYFLSFPIN